MHFIYTILFVGSCSRLEVNQKTEMTYEEIIILIVNLYATCPAIPSANRDTIIIGFIKTAKNSMRRDHERCFETNTERSINVFSTTLPFLKYCVVFIKGIRWPEHKNSGWYSNKTEKWKRGIKPVVKGMFLLKVIIEICVSKKRSQNWYTCKLLNKNQSHFKIILVQVHFLLLTYRTNKIQN